MISMLGEGYFFNITERKQGSSMCVHNFPKPLATNIRPILIKKEAEGKNIIEIIIDHDPLKIYRKASI